MAGEYVVEPASGYDEEHVDELLVLIDVCWLYG